MTLPAPRLILVLVLMGCIIYVTGTFTGIDWAVLFHGFTSTYSPPARFARTLLCAAMVLLIGPMRLDRRDLRLLALALGLTCVADTFLILTRHFIVGVAFFLLVHLVLIARHARGLLGAARGPEAGPVRRYLAVTAALIFVPGALLIHEAAPALEKSGMEGLDVVYMVVLMVSAWMGWGALVFGFYARLNAWCVAVGMSLFFLCDLALGLSHVYATLRPSLASAMGMVPDLTYSAALTLLGLSGFTWRMPDQDEAARLR